MDKYPKPLPITLFNTASREKEAFTPLLGNQVKMYTCGPTVYNFAHIGNFRAYVFEDLLRRTLKFFGYHVTQVMNLTDVDDKTIKGAIANKVSLNDYTKTYKEAFFNDLKRLHIEPAEHYPAATDYIPEMIEMIQGLIDKKVAYQGGDGSVYFAIKEFPRYGCLSHLHLEDLQAGASERVAADEYEKESIADFVLWKAYDPERDGEIFWESPFGRGRPGWHLECSTMAMRILGDTIDIHVGGIDNMFPHHENEIAQSEAYSGKCFVKLWMHCDHLIVDGKKMSKSLGNVYNLNDLIAKGYSGVHVRYMLLQTHYKTQLNFTLPGLDAVKNSLQRLQDFIFRLQKTNSDVLGGFVQPVLEKARKDFITALADDLNISRALASLFDVVREVNILCDQNKVSNRDAEQVLDLLKQFDEVLGILSFEQNNIEIPQEVQALFAQRLQARKEKNFSLSDALRDQIMASGYIIEDAPTGARLRKK
ncbi:Cysteine--tRNA ligase [Chlamydiales bacterium STE3]|nr:Cysteine--tRNA ligase [Chlamydiales bacterium STE3]